MSIKILDFYPGDTNHIEGSFAKLQDLGKPSTSSFHALFKGFETNLLLDGSNVC